MEIFGCANGVLIKAAFVFYLGIRGAQVRVEWDQRTIILIAAFFRA